MEKYYNKVRSSSSHLGFSSPNVNSTSSSQSQGNFTSPNVVFTPPNIVSTSPNVSFDIELVVDPGLRKSIDKNMANIENVRRAYLQKGPCQPKNHNFPWRDYGTMKRRFIPSWFNDHFNWLEYSISKDAAFCLFCYLFKADHGGQGGGDAFVGEGFRNWRKKNRLDVHVGDHNSIHNKCMGACQDLMNQKQHIEVCLSNHSNQTQVDYRLRLTASVDCIRFLFRQGLAFRGHWESEESLNKENFIELLQFLADHNEEVNKVVLKNAPGNLQLTSPTIQYDIINTIAIETTNAIIREVGDGLFAILVDEARDIYVKEQMAVVLRYVDERGFVIERFLSIVHVTDTTALSLKVSIEAIFSKHGLSISSLRGQGYDGASNMQGEFIGLKSLIMMENESAFYVHYFAHQLQLTLVAVAENHSKISTFFETIAILSNVVGASCKRRDILRKKQVENVIQGICLGEILTGRGLNQETTLKWAGDTRWGSHYGTLISLLGLFPSVIDVLLVIGEDGTLAKQRAQADNLLVLIQCFEFVFTLHLMKTILGITNDLSQALQRKDQDIVNAMALVKVTKQQLQRMRDDGWESLLNTISLFCIKHKINIPNMEDMFVFQGRSRRNVEESTNLHYYHVEMFYAVIDSQLQELNSRFNEVNMELLLCMICLDPANSFSTYDKTKLLRFVEFYPNEFSAVELIALEHQLDNYILDMRSNNQFSEIMGVSGLAKKLVQLKKHRVYPLVYLLVKLALLLPVATTTIERVFSAMKIIKTQLRNRLGDDLMNDCFVTYIEKDIFETIDNEDVIQRFQNMKPRRRLL